MITLLRAKVQDQYLDQNLKTKLFETKTAIFGLKTKTMFSVAVLHTTLTTSLVSWAKVIVLYVSKGKFSQL